MRKLDIKKAKSQTLGLLIAIFVIIGSIMLGAISTATEEAEVAIDKNKISGTVEFTLGKYVNYSVENQKGALVELNVKTGLKFEEGVQKVPLKATGIVINSPKINHEYAKKVEIIDGKLINYDAKTGVIKTSTDKENIKVILDYGENCYIAKTAEVQASNNNQNPENIQKQQLQLKGIIYSDLDTETTTIITSNYENTVELEEKSGLISSEISTTPIYNGFIKNKIATTYQENYDINISKKELGDETTFEITNAYGNDIVTYLSSTMVKSNIIDILGNTGSLTITDEQGNEIAKVDNNTQVDEKGLFKFNYSQNISKVLIKITKPAKVGKIRIQSEKQIPAEVQDKTIKNIETSSKISVVNPKEVKEQVIDKQTNKTTTQTKIQETEIYNYQEKAQIEVKESSTQVNLKVEDNKNTWTNERQNELNFTLELPISSNKYNLFKNPSIEIRLPEEVSKVVLDEEILKKASMMHAYGLELKTIDYNAETKTIRVALEGEQKEYINANIATGTTITFPAIVIVGQDINSKEADINVNYSNYLAFDNDALEQGNTVTKVNLVNFKDTVTETQVKEEAQAQAQAEEKASATKDMSETAQAGQEAPYKVTLTSRKHGLVAYNYIYDLKIEGHLQEKSTVKVQLPDCMEIWSYNEVDGKTSSPKVIESTNTMMIEVDPGKDDVKEYNYSISGIVNLNKIYTNSKYNNKTEIQLKTTAILNDKYVSNEDTINLPIKRVNIEMTSPTEGEKINAGDEVKYNIKIKNEGKSDFISDKIDLTNMFLLVTTPEGLTKINVSYNYWDTIKDENETITGVEVKELKDKQYPEVVTTENGERLPNIKIPFSMPQDSVINVEISGIAGLMAKDTKITAYATISNSIGNATFTSFEDQKNTEYNLKEKVNNDTANYVSHTILGNKANNVEREEQEKPEEQGKDEEKEENLEEEEKGTYSINDLESSTNNNDLSLTQNKKPNFVVENYISKITTNKGDNVENKEFDNSKLARIELNAKDLDNTKVTIEYKIKVSNIGEVAGTIGEIVDYVPEGLTFSSTTNSNWIDNLDGTITNKSIATSEIEPGESVELTLILTKDMSQNITTFKNRVAIKSINNSLGYEEKDIDNNSASSELIIPVRTDLFYIMNGVLIAFIILIIILNYKFKIFRTIKFRMLGMIVISIIISVGYGDLGVNADITSTSKQYKYFTLTSRTTTEGSINGSLSGYSARHRYDYPNTKQNFKLFYIEGSYPNDYAHVATKPIYLCMNDTFSYYKSSNSYSGTKYYIEVSGNQYDLESFGFNNTEARKMYNYIDSVWSHNKGKTLGSSTMNCTFLYISRDWRVAVDPRTTTYINGFGYKYQAIGLCIDPNIDYIGDNYKTEYDGYAELYDWEHVYEANDENINVSESPVNMYKVSSYDNDNYGTAKYYFDPSNSLDYNFNDLSNITCSYAEHEVANINVTYYTNPIKRSIKGNYTVFGPITCYKNNNDNIWINSSDGAILNNNSNLKLTMCDSDGNSYSYGNYTISNSSSNPSKFYFRIKTSDIQNTTVNTITVKIDGNEYYGGYSIKSQGKAEVIWHSCTNSSRQRFITKENVKINFNGGYNGLTSAYMYFSPEETPPTNPPETAKGSLQITKKDSSGNNNLDSIVFKILDVNANKWVQVEKSNGKYKYCGTVGTYYTGSVAPDAWENGKWYSTFETGNDGKTVKIEGLPAYKTYDIYEISAGKYSYLYDLGTFEWNGTRKGKKAERVVIDKDSLKAVTYKNTPTSINLQVEKKDQQNRGRVNGIKFKIFDKTVNKWVQVEKKDGKFIYCGAVETYYTGSVAPDAWENGKWYSTFETGSSGIYKGKTVVIYGLPKNHKYRVFEIDAGKYSQYFNLGTFSYQNVKRKGKRIDNGNNKYYIPEESLYDFGTASEKETDVITVTATNSTNTANIQIVKKDKNSGNPLQGIKFKVLDKTENKWVQVKRQGELFVYSTVVDSYSTNAATSNNWSTNNNNWGEGVSYSTFSTDSNGKTVNISGLDYNHTYRIYEVGLGNYAGIYQLETFSYKGVKRDGTRLRFNKNATINPTLGNTFNEDGDLKLKADINVVTIKAQNESPSTTLKIVKEEKNGEEVAGIKFKIWSSKGGWVSAKYNSSHDNYIYNGIVTKVTSADNMTPNPWQTIKDNMSLKSFNYTTFITYAANGFASNSSSFGGDTKGGKTVDIEGLPLDATYKIYEIKDGNPYENICDFITYSFDNGVRFDAIKLIGGNNGNTTIDNGTIDNQGEINFIPGLDGKTTLTMTNEGVGSLKIIKQNEEGQKLSSGFKFKILDVENLKWIGYRYDSENQKFTVLDKDGYLIEKDLTNNNDEVTIELNIPVPGSSWWNTYDRLNIYLQTLQTYSNGETITLEDLPIGPNHTYKIYEVAIPDEYTDKYKLQEQTIRGDVTFKGILLNKDNTVAKGSANQNLVIGKHGIIPGFKNNSTLSVTMTNIEEKGFKVKKVDKDTGTPLKGIKFKLFNVRDHSWVKVKYDGSSYVYDGPTSEYNTNIPNTSWAINESYSTFVTDANGELITIIGLPKEKASGEEIIYQLYEVELPSEYQDIYSLGTFDYSYGLGSSKRTGNVVEIDSNKSTNIKLYNSGMFAITDNTDIIITTVNKKDEKYSISGFVWEDHVQIKGVDDIYQFDSLYHGEIVNVSTPDKPKDGVTVVLLKNGVSVDSKVTDANGEYIFENLEKEALENNQYSIEFTYNGYTYQAVNKEVGDNPQITSKAQENTASRNNINKKGENITKHKDTKNINITATISGDTIKNYYEQIKNTNLKTIKNQNLGIYNRAMPDLAIAKSLNKAIVSVNGVKYTYNSENGMTEGKHSLPNTIMGMRKEDFINEYVNATEYNSPIYNADIDYSLDNNTSIDNKLNVTLEYKISLKNESNRLYSKVNALNEFYTNNMYWENSEIKVYDSENNEIEILFVETEPLRPATNPELNGCTYERIQFTKGIIIPPNKTRDIYVRFNIPETYFKNHEAFGTDRFRNYVEISSYSVYENQDLRPYFGYDIDSEPNNLNSYHVGCFEDDDDRAPGLKLIDAGIRTISGTVFEDKAILVENGKSIGNSELDSNENKVQNVLVQIQLLKDNGDLITDSYGNPVLYATKTDQNGDFTFNDVPAGNYIVKYIWGEGVSEEIGESTKIVTGTGERIEVKVDKYDATEWSSNNIAEKDNPKWYRNDTPRYSDAKGDIVIDNKKQATTLLDKPIVISPSYDLADPENDGYYRKPGETIWRFDIKNIDFGIIKKVFAQFKIDKRVKHIKISTGSMVLVNADVNDEQTGFKNAEDVLFFSKYIQPDNTTYGMIITEIDGLYPLEVEVTYEVELKLKNIDKLTQEQKNKIKIFDYLDKKYANIKQISGYSSLTLDEYNTMFNRKTSTPEYTEIEREYEKYWSTSSIEPRKLIESIYDEWISIAKNEGKTVKDAANAKISGRNIYELTNLEEQLKALDHDETISFEFTASTIAANNKDNINYLNDVEIVGIDTDDDNPIENLYDRAEEVIITPPTGENKNIPNAIIISIVALGSIVVLAIGGKLIKKKTK